MIRKDVFRLAEKLSVATGFAAWEVYDWLMEVGRAKSVNPARLDYIAGRKIVFVQGERDDYCMEQYKAPRKWEQEYTGPDYESMILARQENYMD